MWIKLDDGTAGERIGKKYGQGKPYKEKFCPSWGSVIFCFECNGGV